MKLSLFAGFLIAVGCASKGLCLEALSPLTQQPLHNLPPTALAQTGLDTIMANGIYLYGESPQLEVLGQSYLLFEVEDGEAVGAFYMPASEFSCFSGTIDAQRLDLMVTAPYESTPYAYSLPLQQVSESIATAEGQAILATSAKIEGYHHIESHPTIRNLDHNSQRILQTCRSTPAGSAPAEV